MAEELAKLLVGQSSSSSGSSGEFITKALVVRDDALTASYLATLETLCVDHEIGLKVQQIIASTFHGQKFMYFLAIEEEEKKERAAGKKNYVVDRMTKLIGKATEKASKEETKPEKRKKAELAKQSVVDGTFKPFVFVSPDAATTAECRRLIRTGRFKTWKDDPTEPDAPMDVE